jgi:hypothetical protein
MNIVNGFDIDTVEGAEAYLKSEGVDVDAYIERGLAELKKQKALDLANVVDTCPYCKGLGYDPINNLIGVHDLCPECKGH